MYNSNTYNNIYYTHIHAYIYIYIFVDIMWIISLFSVGSYISYRPTFLHLYTKMYKVML